MELPLTGGGEGGEKKTCVSVCVCVSVLCPRPSEMCHLDPTVLALSGNHHCLKAEAPGGWILALAKIMWFYFDDTAFGKRFMMWGVAPRSLNLTILFIN